MISVLTMAANAVTSLLVSVLKAIFSMLTWFLKAFFKLLKLFYCFLPITAILFFVLLCANIFLLVGGSYGLLSLGTNPPAHNFNLPSGDLIQNEKIREEAGELIENNNAVVVNMFSALQMWWTDSVYSYKGTITYIFLFMLTIIMFVPVITVLLCMSVFMSFGNLLFIGIMVDVIFYLLRALLGTNFMEQAMDRYYKLFPEAGKKHYEKDYEKWLKRHHDEFNDDYDDKYEKKRRRRDSFYEDDVDYDEDDDYDNEYDEEDYEDYYEEDDEEYDEDIDDDYYGEDDEYYEDEGYDDEDDYYENNRKNGSRDRSNNSIPNASSFDFFAGCKTRESADRKYKSLVKLYHPDNMDGDTAALQEINVQYDKAKKRLS